MVTIEALSRQFAAQAIQGAIDSVNRAFDGAARPGSAQAPSHERRGPGRPREFSRDDLRRLHAQGLSDVRIAVELGASRSAVQDARRRLGLAANFAKFGNGTTSRDKLSDDDLRRMHGDGMSDLAIARSCGIASSVAHRRRVGLGLPANYNGRAKL